MSQSKMTNFFNRNPSLNSAPLLPISEKSDLANLNLSTETCDLTVSDLGIKDEGPCRPILPKYLATTDTSGHNRSFNSSWYATYNWLEYSVAKNSAFCFPCRIFTSSSANREDTFSTIGFNVWKNAIRSFNTHTKCASHIDSETKWKSYQQSKIHGSVAVQNSAHHAVTVLENRDYLNRIIDSLLYLAGQGLGLRGHDETKDSLNCGNFIELLDLISKYDEFFKNKRNLLTERQQCHSNRTQNDLIQCAAAQLIKEISESVLDAGNSSAGPTFVSIMADESRDTSRKEQLSVCIRYITKEYKIAEEFLGFLHLYSFDAKTIADSIRKVVNDAGLNSCFIVAQCYDGASVMAGHLNGVQAIIQKENPEAYYVHCYAHRLNLVLVDSVKKVKHSAEFFSIVEHLYVFFTRSAKIHEEYVALQKSKNLPVLELKALSDTRWACRYQSINAIFRRFDVIIELLEILADSDKPDDSVTALGLLSKIKSVTFTTMLVIFQKLLGITEVLSELLQKKSCNQADAVNAVDGVKDALMEMRNNDWSKIWNDTVELCSKHNISLLLSNKASRKRRRIEKQDEIILSSVGQTDWSSEDTESALKIDLFYSNFDHVLSEINKRFSAKNLDIMQAVHALLSVDSAEFLNVEMIKPFVKTYARCLNFEDEDLFEAQIAVCKAIILKHNCSSIEECLPLIKSCGEYLVRCIRLALTLPISSASCERSFSAMGFIKNDLRSTMTDLRLSHLSILFCNKMRLPLIDRNKIIERYAAHKNRKLALV